MRQLKRRYGKQVGMNAITGKPSCAGGTAQFTIDLRDERGNAVDMEDTEVIARIGGELVDCELLKDRSTVILKNLNKHDGNRVTLVLKHPNHPVRAIDVELFRSPLREGLDNSNFTL